MRGMPKARKKRKSVASIGIGTSVLAATGLGTAAALGAGMIGAIPAAGASSCYETSHAEAEATHNIFLFGGEQEMAEVDNQTQASYDCKSGDLQGINIQVGACYSWFDADATSNAACGYTPSLSKTSVSTDAYGAYWSDTTSAVYWEIHAVTTFYDTGGVSPVQSTYCYAVNAPNHSANNIHCFSGPGPF